MFNNFNKHYKFGLKPGVYFHNACYVYPSKQQAVQELYNKCLIDTNITLLVIYGAAVSLDCYPYSSINVYVETRNKGRYNSIDINNEDCIEVVANIDDWEGMTAHEIADMGIVIFDRRKS